MNYGVVTWSMDGMGTISLEEPKIKTIKSIKQFEIKLKEGLIYFGSMDTSNTPHHVKIVLTNGTELVNINSIVEVYPIKKSMWNRLSGNFSLGLNYTKGSEIATFVLSGDLSYRKRSAYVDLNWSSNNTFNILEDSLTSTKADVVLSWQQNLDKNWSTGLLLGYSQNSQLGIKFRLDLTGVGIRDIAYNHWTRLWVGAGLSVQHETSLNDESVTDDLAGVAMLVWRVYKYTSPKVWVESSVNFFPYITGNSRYRVNVNVGPKISVINDDLQVGFTYYYAYDTRPPSEASSTFDWGINLEVTYSFH